MIRLEKAGAEDLETIIAIQRASFKAPMILKIRKTTHIAVSKASRVSLCSW